MKALSTILLTCISFWVSGQCLLDPNHFHCSKQFQQTIQQMQQDILRLQENRNGSPANGSCVINGCEWKTEAILNNNPNYFVRNGSQYTFVKIDGWKAAFVEYHIFISNLTQAQGTILFDLPTGIDPHHNTVVQADLLFDAQFQTAHVDINSTTKKIIFRRQTGKFYVNPHVMEIKGRFFIRWQ